MRIRQMTPADIPFGLKLKAQNRWNQLESDWRRQLDLEPDGCFLAEVEGQAAGTACTCIFDDVAWINMVLVDEKLRGKGIGSALMVQVLQHLDQLGISSIRLDATPLGQPVYEKLGFAGEFTLARLEGVPQGTSAAASGVEPLALADLPQVCRLDAGITRTRREKLLRYLFEAAPGLMQKFVAQAVLQGFSLARPGSNAWHIGPIQGSLEAGRQLLLDVAQRFAGQVVYLDVPIDNAEAIALGMAMGLRVQRHFLRMGRGRRVLEDLASYWCSFGPEKG